MSVKQLCNNYVENMNLMQRALRVSYSFDIVSRKIQIGNRKACLYFIDGFAKDEILEKIMEFIMKLNPEDIPLQLSSFEQQFIPYVEVTLEKELSTIVTQVLSGTIMLLVEGYSQAIAIDARTYPNRSISEPEDERVLRGSRDGFVETLVFNTALLRRRIRDPHLTMKIMQIGQKSHTDVVMCYMSDKADPAMVAMIEKKLKAVDIPSLTLSQESLAECLIKKHWWNPFPRFRYTERPDAASANIMEGKVILIVDNTPAVMILPTSFFDFIQDTNDYYFPPLVGSYLRIVRMIVFLLTLFLTPIWYLAVKNPTLFPDWISFIQIEEMNSVPIIIQLLLVEFIIDAIKLASLNTPSALNGSFSVVGALILGDFAVKAHWFVPEVLLYMAFVSIANFTQPSYELGYTFKLFRLLFLIMIACLDVWGLVLGIILMLLILANTHTITETSYLYPLYPFNTQKFCQLFLRQPINKNNS